MATEVKVKAAAAAGSGGGRFSQDQSALMRSTMPSGQSAEIGASS